VHEANVERNDSLLTGRNLWQNQTQEEGTTNTITPFKGYQLRQGNTS